MFFPKPTFDQKALKSIEKELTQMFDDLEEIQRINKDLIHSQVFGDGLN